MMLSTIFKAYLKITDIIEATDGQQAYTMAIKNHFDIIILDLDMPMMSGYQAASEIKEYYFNE